MGGAGCLSSGVLWGAGCLATGCAEGLLAQQWGGLLRNGCWGDCLATGHGRVQVLTAPPAPCAGPASKQSIREKIWAHLEASGLAEFPRPVHHRIPNFKVLHCPGACRRGDGCRADAGCRLSKGWPETRASRPDPSRLCRGWRALLHRFVGERAAKEVRVVMPISQRGRLRRGSPPAWPWTRISGGATVPRGCSRAVYVMQGER